VSLIPSLYPPYTLLIPCLIPSSIQVGSGFLYPYTLFCGSGCCTAPSLPLHTLSKGIRGYKGIRSSVERRSFPYTLLIPPQGERYKATERRAPGCIVCGGSGLDITRPLPWGGYESCARCVLQPGQPAAVHPGWKRMPKPEAA